jgi:GxxExxY protein
MNTDELKYSALTEKVIGAFYDVAYELGPGFLESVYQRALLIRFNELGVQAAAEVNVPVFFHGQQVGDFRADMVVEGKLLLELKAVDRLVSSHEGQTLHYLKATEFEVALLMNFGSLKPEFKRVILESHYKKPRTRTASAFTT